MPTSPASLTGVVLSLMTAVFWAISPMCMASAGRRIGSFAALLLRSLLASVVLLALLPLYVRMTGVHVSLPTLHQTGWLVLSAVFGMVVGDAFYYESLVTLGPRRSTQVMTLAPVASVLLGWMLLGEHLGFQALLGIAMVIAGTFYAVKARPSPTDGDREPGRLCVSGVLFAVAGAACVGIGAVTGRRAFVSGPPLDAVVATVIRVGSCAAMLWVIPLVRRSVGRTLMHLTNGFVLRRMTLGVAAGPMAGMLCYVFALRQLQAGLVSTLVAMSPLFILPMVIVRYRVRIGADLILAAVVALAGVALMCT